jgi:FkbM family methyltransferase
LPQAIAVKTVIDNILRKLTSFHDDSALFGLFGACKLRLMKFLPMISASARQSKRAFTLQMDGMSSPIHLRCNTSDSWVLRQVLVQEEYRAARDIKAPKLLIDCGANVGFASVWFLNHFDGLNAIVIEPDPGNFALCQRNLASFEGRAICKNVGVWPRRTGLAVIRTPEGEWGFRVRETAPGEDVEVEAVDIMSLLRESRFGKIDILKIDIEGAERELFAANPRVWLDHVENLFIELHGEEAERIFNKAMSEYDFERGVDRETVYCRNIKRRRTVCVTREGKVSDSPRL